MSEYHLPIMVDEVLKGLDIRSGGIYFDGTAGGGGHSFAILASDPTVRLIATDKDGDAIKAVQERLTPFAGRYKLYRSDFKDYKKCLQMRAWKRWTAICSISGSPPIRSIPASGGSLT